VVSVVVVFVAVFVQWFTVGKVLKVFSGLESKFN
jgi:hypothetical protein